MSGPGVLVTRALPEAERTAVRLAALGFEPVVAPVLAIRALDTPMPEGAFAAVLVTSAHSAPALAAAAGQLVDAPVFAVGERTAQALREAGIGAVEACGGTATDVARRVARKVSAGTRLLQIVGRDHKPEPALTLATNGFAVVPWIVYAADAEPVLPAQAVAVLQTNEVGFALHYSRRSVEILLALAERAGLAPALAGIAHVCLSCDVAAPLRVRVGGTIAVSETPDEDALLAALLALSPEAAATGSPAPHSRC